jgi:hypothetical protein
MATSVHCSWEGARCSSAKVPTITKQPTDFWHQVVAKSSHFCTGSLFAEASSPPHPPIASAAAAVTNAKIPEHIKCLHIRKCPARWRPRERRTTLRQGHRLINQAHEKKVNGTAPARQSWRRLFAPTPGGGAVFRPNCCYGRAAAIRFTASGSSRSFSHAKLKRANGLGCPSNA